ncbi:MAG: hypothetical protein HQK53_01495 [Oligoflexia bacterium]|nr:hypothetical protein [Oligoflexia bacterium]
MDILLSWIQDHLLAIIAVGITLVLLFNYLLEKDYATRLSKKYRNSIFEAQSKIFLNATQYLISGNRDLAIKEFLNAMDLNRETTETYFALGGLFRSSGEIEKAISIHRSLMVKNNLSESIRIRALKELALDFDKGGFVDKAIETYKDVLKVNRDQPDVLQALCRIFEDVEEWDDAYKHRILLSKVSNQDQSETISHILVQKAKKLFENGDYASSIEILDDAFKFAPSVSAKILRLKLFIVQGSIENAKTLLLELLRERPMYASFLFISLNEGVGTKNNGKQENKQNDLYYPRLKTLSHLFLSLNDKDLLSSPSVILSKVRLLKDEKQLDAAHDLLQSWVQTNKNSNEVLKVEFIKILIEMGKKDQALTEVTSLLDKLGQSLTRHFCSQCGYNSDNVFWRCPQCKEWETIQFRWKV